MKRKSVYKQFLKYNVTDVFDVVTNNRETGWRSDLEKTEIISEKKFREVFKNGNVTEFYMTKLEPNTFYQFEMKNKFFEGTWEGCFKKIAEEETEIIFSEQIEIFNFGIYLLSFFVLNLKKIQKTYVSDLVSYLGKIKGD